MKKASTRSFTINVQRFVKRSHFCHNGLWLINKLKVLLFIYLLHGSPPVNMIWAWTQFLCYCGKLARLHNSSDRWWLWWYRSVPFKVTWTLHGPRYKQASFGSSIEPTLIYALLIRSCLGAAHTRLSVIPSDE